MEKIDTNSHSSLSFFNETEHEFSRALLEATCSNVSAISCMKSVKHFERNLGPVK